MTYELVSADALNADQTRVLRAIYEGGYPADRRAPWSQVLATRPSYEDALALMRDDVPVGLALIRAIPDTGTVILRHLVIDGSQRGHALGALLWQRVTDLAARRGFSRLVWDVAHPDDPPKESAECDARLRRIGLYERVGGALQPIGEYAPPDRGSTQWIPMRLLATSLDASEPAPDPRTLRRLALDVYAERHDNAAYDVDVLSPPMSIGDDDG